MENPALKGRPEYMTPPEPKTDIPKAIRRSFINWVVPTLCLGVVMCAFLVVQNWGDGRYITKSSSDNRALEFQKRLAEESQKREDLEKTVQTVDRKLDLIIYILQRDGKIPPQALQPQGP